MTTLLRKHKIFIIVMSLFIFLALLFKSYKVMNVDPRKVNKEIVNVVFRQDEISYGISQLVDRFNENSDDIFIELEVYNEDYKNVAINKMANENKIDIMNYMGKTQMEKEFIKPLDSIGIDYSNLQEGELLKFNDEVIGVKYGSAMPKLLYNNDILEKAGIDPNNKPKNLEELVELTKQIKESIPDVVPMTIATGDVHDVFALFGGPSASLNSTYPTFWNYKTGEYDYSSLELVIEKYREMYELGLLNDNIDTITGEDMLVNFINGKTAIIPTNYFQKYSIKFRTEGMDVSFSNIPPYDEANDIQYYYNRQRILVIANNYGRSTDTEENLDYEKLNKHDEAVREVYEWLLSDECTEFLVQDDFNFATFGDNYFNGTVYDGLNDNTGYNFTTYDPTEIFAGNSSIIRDGIAKIVKGEIGVDEGIEELSKNNNDYINNNLRNKDVNREAYKEKDNE